VTSSPYGQAACRNSYGLFPAKSREREHSGDIAHPRLELVECFGQAEDLRNAGDQSLAAHRAAPTGAQLQRRVGREIRSSRAYANRRRRTDATVLLVLPEAGESSCSVSSRIVSFRSGRSRSPIKAAPTAPLARRQRRALPLRGPPAARRAIGTHAQVSHAIRKGTTPWPDRASRVKEVTESAGHQLEAIQAETRMPPRAAFH
jgi:hypothetical protein